MTPSSCYSRSRPAASCLLLAIPLVMLAGCSGGPPVRSEGAPPGSAESTVLPTGLAVAAFDTAWALIDRNHYDPQHGGVDWAAVREELRPRALATTRRDSLRALLNEMIVRTGLSHFALIPGEAVDALQAGDAAGDRPDGARDGSAGLEVRLVDDELLVWRVEPDSPAAEAGVDPGWVLTAVDSTRFADVLEATAEAVPARELVYRLVLLARELLDGPVGSEVRLVVRDAADREHDLALVRGPQPGVMSRFGNLPPIRTRIEDELIEHAGRRIGLIRFNIWLLPIAAAFDAAIDRHRDADAIVIDLRGNLGGVGGMAMGLAGHFLEEPLSLGEMRTRGSVLHFRANPRRVNPDGRRVRPFAGPVAILQDPLSMSTSEIFAQGLQVLGRARVFGETSGGQALPSRLERLPGGDVLQFAFADFVDPQGTRLEGRGVIPDQTAPLSRAELTAGRDGPLEAALRWITSVLDETALR